MIWLPQPILADQGVGEDEQFSHDCGYGDLRQFSFGDEAIVECFHIGVVRWAALWAGM